MHIHSHFITLSGNAFVIVVLWSFIVIFVYMQKTGQWTQWCLWSIFTLQLIFILLIFIFFVWWYWDNNKCVIKRTCLYSSAVGVQMCELSILFIYFFRFRKQSADQIRAREEWQEVRWRVNFLSSEEKLDQDLDVRQMGLNSKKTRENTLYFSLLSVLDALKTSGWSHRVCNSPEFTTQQVSPSLSALLT